jgi:hypothetical protein
MIVPFTSESEVAMEEGDLRNEDVSVKSSPPEALNCGSVGVR